MCVWVFLCDQKDFKTLMILLTNGCNLCRLNRGNINMLMLYRLAIAMAMVEKNNNQLSILSQIISSIKEQYLKALISYHFYHSDGHLIKQLSIERKTVMIGDDCILIISCDNYLTYLSGIITSFPSKSKSFWILDDSYMENIPKYFKENSICSLFK